MMETPIGYWRCTYCGEVHEVFAGSSTASLGVVTNGWSICPNDPDKPVTRSVPLKWVHEKPDELMEVQATQGK
jgi:hypothetical protein